MKNIIIIILLLSSLCSFGQKYAIKSKLLKSGNIKIDSIEVQISVFEDRIETESYFEKSKTKLSVFYFKTGKSYSNIRTRENNLAFENCCRVNEFDFENGKAINGEESFYLDQKLNGISGSFEKVAKSYSKALNSKFLENYVVELFEATKNYR